MTEHTNESALEQEVTRLRTALEESERAYNQERLDYREAWRLKKAAETTIKEIDTYISCLDGSTGSKMWRIHTDIRGIIMRNER